MADPDVPKIGKYQILAELGQGGFGKVYRAFDPTVGRPVAIKILTTDGNPDLLTRFRNEAAAAGKLKHKNIVTVHEFGEHDGRPFLVMELLEGQDLLQIMKDRTPLTLLQKMNIMDQVAEGLYDAHSNGVIHRDIKPANIRLLPDGTVKIMDFGVARVSRDRDETRLTQQGDLIGTILYMSPEQFTGAGADVLSDIFAFGVTYYELLTGKHPFQSTDPARVMFKISMEDPEPLRSLAPEVPEGLEQIIGRAIQKDRELRYQDLRDLRLDAEPLLFELQQDRASALALQARQRSEAGDSDGALSLIHEAMELDPGNRAVRQLRESVQRQVQQQTLQSRLNVMLQTAEEQISRREFASGIQTLEQALKLDQTNFRTRAALDAARAQMQRFKDSARLVSDALMDLRKGDFGAAEKKGSEAALLDPQNAEAERVLADARKQRSIRERLREVEALEARGELGAAIDQLQKLSSLYPDTREVKRLLDDALARKADEDRLNTMIAEADQSIDASKFQDAIEVLTKALIQFPNEARIQKLLIRADEALQAQRRTAQIDQVLRAAESLKSASDFEAAFREIDRALAQFPGEPRLTGLRANAEVAKQASEREKFLRRTVRHAEIFRGNAQFAEALDVVHGALKKYENEPVLLNLEAEINQQRDRQQQAEVVRQSVKAGDEGRFQDAVELLESARQRYPDSSEIQTLLRWSQVELQGQKRREAVENSAREAQAALDRQDFDAAARTLEKALESSPGESQLEELHQKTRIARQAFEREQAIAEVLRHGNELRGRQNFSDALLAVRAGLKAYAQEPPLLALEKELLADIERRQRAEAIQRAIEQAQDLLLQGETQQAVQSLESATQQYAGASELQTPLTQARQRLEGIQQAARTARGQAKQKEFEPALNTLDSALQAWPGEAELEELRRSVNSQKSEWELELWEQKKKSEGIEQAAREAGDWMERKDFRQASSLLEKALESWPGEARLSQMLQGVETARAGWEREQAVAAVVKQCESLRANRKIADALKAVRTGLKTYPAEPALVRIEEQLVEQQERDRRAEAVKRRLEKAQGFLDQGQTEQAIQALEKASVEFPESSELQSLFGQARARFEAVQKAARDAQGLLQQQQFDPALTTLHQALQNWSGEFQLTALLQKITVAKSAWEAEDRTRQAQAEAVGAAVAEGRRLLDAGELGEAAETLEAAVKQFPEETELQTLLSRANTELEVQHKRQAQEKATREREQAVTAIVREFNQLRANQKLDTALNMVRVALKTYQDEPALSQLEKELGEQLELQQRAAAVRQKLTEGEELLARGQTAVAVHTIEASSAQYPDAAELQNLLIEARQRLAAVQRVAGEAQGFAQRNEFAPALELLEQALRSWPAETQLTTLLQTIDWAKQEWEKQQREREQRAEAIRKSAAEAQRLLDTGFLRQAVDFLQNTSSRYPDAAELKTLLNRARAELEAEEQREAAERAAREREQRAEGIRKSAAEGQRLLDTGLFRQAADLLETASRQYPDAAELKTLLNRARAEIEAEQQRAVAERAARERERAVAVIVGECEQLIAGQKFPKARKALQAGLRKYQQEPALLELEQKLTAAAARKQAPPVQPVVQGEPPVERQPALQREPVQVTGRSRAKLVYIGVAAAAVLGAAVFVPRLFRSQGIALALTSNVQGASINVGNASCVMPNCALALPPGTYKLSAAKDGYQTLNQTISVPKGGSEMNVPLTFEPLPQLVQVNTNFANGRVYLDDQPAAELRDGQFSVASVAPGLHTLRVTSGDAQFQTEWRTAVGASPDLQRPIAAKNVQATVIASIGQKGSIACDCDPKTIKVDGVEIGATSSGPQGVPLSDLKEGTRRINIGERSLVVDVKPNPSLNVFLSLDREVGTLVLDTGQDGAKVYINGRPFHRLTEHGSVRIPLDVGQYQVRVEKAGFQTPAAQTIGLSKGEDKRLAFNLVPTPPELEIAGALPGTQVRIDGSVIGETDAAGSLRREVRPGTHQVELSKSDYSDVRFTSEFTPGRTTRPDRSQFTMARLPKTPPPPPPPAETKPTEAQEWERVRASNTPEELDEFIRKYPSGANVEEARSRASQLRSQAEAAAARRAEQAAWNALDKSNRAALQDFLSRYGAGPHAPDARGLLAGIVKQESDAASERAAAAERVNEQKQKEQEQANAAVADSLAIAGALTAYENAYNAKDIKGLQAAWQDMPKNMADVTRRQFGDAKTINFQLRPLGKPAVNGDSATITCTRSLRLTTKFGKGPDMAGERVRVTLRRAGGAWLIQSITPI